MGTVLLLAFSIGRTQELFYEIEDILYQVSANKKNFNNFVWEYLDVIIDSPLAAELSQSYLELKNLWDKEAMHKVKAGRHPLSFDSLLTVNSHKELLETVEYLRKTGRLAIVVTASGMCVGGRIHN